MLLDDSFSALDGKTESRVVENLLGPNGLFKKTGTTVFLVVTSGMFTHGPQFVIEVLTSLKHRISIWLIGSFSLGMVRSDIKELGPT